jgi:hypothetical protein
VLVGRFLINHHHQFFNFKNQGFSIRTPKFLIPLFANNLLSAGNDAIAPVEDVTYNDNDLLSGPIIQKRKRHHHPPRKEEAGLSIDEVLAQREDEQTKEDRSPSCKLDTTLEVAPIIAPSSEEKDQAKPLPERSDAEILELVKQGKLPPYMLEKSLGDMERAVRIRRLLLGAHSALSPRHCVALAIDLCVCVWLTFSSAGLSSFSISQRSTWDAQVSTCSRCHSSSSTIPQCSAAAART